MGQMGESDLAVVDVPVVPDFPATVKFSTTSISLTATAWASSTLLSHVFFYLMLLYALC